MRATTPLRVWLVTTGEQAGADGDGDGGEQRLWICVDAGCGELDQCGGWPWAERRGDGDERGEHDGADEHKREPDSGRAYGDPKRERAGGADASNYTFAGVVGDYTVNKLALTGRSRRRAARMDRR